MSSSIAIKVESVGKCYQIYDRPEDRLKQSIYPKFQKLSGIQLKHYYREFWALNNVSFEIKKGETVGIIGRNGSGKSTLLHMICGTLNPTCGKIQVEGRVAALLELGSGFNPEFTGRENIYLNASILGLKNNEIEARYQEIVDFADIGDFIDQPIKTYSSGMLVRLAFAVIANVDADVLVIDEALAVGDIFFVQKCMRYLRKFKESGTLVFVSHDLGAVKNFCQTAILLDSGKILSYGNAQEVCDKYLQSNHGGKSNYGDLDCHEQKEPQSLDSFLDQRSLLINSSNLRNDIKILNFDPNASSFGAGGAKIISVFMSNLKNEPYEWIVGGEFVRLKIAAKTLLQISDPIVGFFIKDRLGQYLFGDNTFLSTMHNDQAIIQAGSTIDAEFDFFMPRLARGNYSIDVAIASGSQEEHIQHHWMHDAIAFESHASSVCTGIIGIPMNRINLEIKYA